MKTLPVLLAAVALGIAAPAVAENYYYHGPPATRARPSLV